MHHNHYNWYPELMWAIWIPVILLLAVFIYRYFNSINKNKYSEQESPLDILKRRYANGEISTEEYEKRKKTLEDKN